MSQAQTMERASASFDPYALTPDAIAAPPSTLWSALRQIGPGLILAGAIVGTGELIATTNLGAKVGFALLWAVIFSCFIKVFVQVELGRYAISSGKTSMTSFSELPHGGSVTGWVWMVMILTTQLQLGAMVGGVGQACHMVLPSAAPAFAKWIGAIHGGAGAFFAARPEMAWGALVTLGTVLLLARGSYAIVEIGTTVLVVMFTVVTVLCVVLLPAAGHHIDWGAVAGGFEIKLPPGSVHYALAMFGITGVGAAELVAYPYWCIEKGYARRTGRNDGSLEWLTRAKGWLRVMRLDTWVSFVIYTLATVAFYFLGAAVLHGGSADAASQGLPTTVDMMLVTLSHMYAPVMGDKLSLWFIVIGVFAVLYSTLFAATGANSRAMSDFLRAYGFIRFDKPRDRRRWVVGMCIVFPIVDFALFTWLGNPVKMVTIGGIAQAATLPMVGAAAIYVRYRRTDKRLAPGKLWDLMLWLSVSGLALAAAVGLMSALGMI